MEDKKTTASQTLDKETSETTQRKLVVVQSSSFDSLPSDDGTSTMNELRNAFDDQGHMDSHDEIDDGVALSLDSQENHGEDSDDFAFDPDDTTTSQLRFGAPSAA